MTSILTITLNPTVDLSIGADKVEPERKLRCTRPETDPGGGGINVSRGILELGGHSTAFVAVGGLTGDKVMRLLAEAGIGLAPFPAPGETRQSLTVTDQSSGLQYRFVMPGPEWKSGDVTRALTRIGRAAPENGIVVLSGSQPPGVPDDFPARLAARIARTRAQLFLDTSGAALHCLLRNCTAPADVLRMDDLEAEDLAGRKLPSRADSADFAQSLVRRGLARAVIVARGGDGNVLATAENRWVAEAAKVDVVSKVGAGDSFVAAFTLSLSRGLSMPEALQWGAAAASAAVTTSATDLCHLPMVRKLLPHSAVSTL
ncbi:1-phosphofructokinase family hexose kinase [Pseudothioclava nitratireducens]|uniref:1-phosphofructokinase family hexose kinase n=1 Tax=Pseudothioclava nitratireducens TaxID=1928646 RepID=UPI0023DAD88F|nr:1-phosphofructokinase family hexose kinase [Defluviimonas nitratireducens]MDF1621458.1 1-phosphofructokinase family hexose kinase [Defluviimonas nitratireducens]